MPTEPAQLFLAVLELTLLFTGVGLLLWLLFNQRQRQRWLGTHSLPQLAVAPAEFVLGVAVIFLTGFGCNAVVQILAGKKLAAMADHEGLQLIVFNVANYAGALVGWRLLLPYLLRSWQVGPNLPTGRATRQTIPWAEATGYAFATLLVALPVLTLISLGWTQLLRAIGLPDAPQDLIGLFKEIKSPLVVAGMLLIACVGAPIYEELIFRAGIYRYLRQKFGRTPALLVSGFCFASLHGNWAGLLPLAVLGMLLAIVYEVTGSIRVPIMAHGLFNLNTIVIILSGLQQVSS